MSSLEVQAGQGLVIFLPPTLEWQGVIVLSHYAWLDPHITNWEAGWDSSSAWLGRLKQDRVYMHVCVCVCVYMCARAHAYTHAKSPATWENSVEGSSPAYNHKLLPVPLLSPL